MFTIIYTLYLSGVFIVTIITSKINIMPLQILAAMVGVGYIVTGMVSLQRYYERHFN